ncbi:pimeloyl-ACP methyl ester carboxylesterase [Actinoplanes lutulentus]|uniref:Pimeloyl-ACP methyl ester carboxylesterase n=1 Tax=Actinoplanes lutulentus TaxID=1287878 RepID=A0A327ZLN2_9ACTN|nr:alpha/beta hydrolase [Actinoplanes lutulentus]MBB2940942.1 pimeloyl-ACP methyl ester carboxylesterase [Actinoplanes lutulentus]RAK43251.1 pimeloyl-ACP methyl ester carboxylesterase [Actinoplanes lutulentus]
MSSPVSRRVVLAGTAAAAAVAATGVPAAAQAAGLHGKGPKPTIVLVHGAFADAAGWSDVIKRLTGEGYTVFAPANPLRGVASDAAYIASFLATITGPIVLVGHSYGGFVITNAATGNPNVKALVYIAAFAPDAGEDVGHLTAQFPGSLLDPATSIDFRPWAGGYDGYVKKDVFRTVFAGDLPRSTTDVLWATQRPGDASTLQSPSGAPAWQTIPSFFLVASQDNLIPPALQRFMAQRAGSHTVEVKASHVAMISQPRAAADLIRKAAR